MKKDKEIVLRKIKSLNKSKLHFVETDWFDNIDEDQDYVKNDVARLKRESSIEDRALRIISMLDEFATFDVNDKFQCRKGANRSTVDIWRIYNNYFRPIGIFSIMRVLYKLVVDGNIATLYCNDIKKQVFCCGDYDETEFESVFIVNELGVRFAEWRTIGL